MSAPRGRWLPGALLVAGLAAPAFAGPSEMPSTQHRHGYGESARQHEGPPPPALETPPLPDGMSLEEVLARAAEPPPPHFPDPIPDDEIHGFLLFEQLEYRVQEDGPDALGWEAQGWVGLDYDRLWWKSEGEAAFDGPDEGESENDLLYSRLLTPFWSAQAGVQYAVAWEPGRTRDRWSGVLALQGMAPGMLELDASLYVSEDGDVTIELEGEYDLRLTQRLVLQPRVELGFAAQDVPARGLGAGLTDAHLDLRLRYELRRTFAPYLGVRGRFFAGETANLAEGAGVDAEALFGFAGIRLAF